MSHASQQSPPRGRLTSANAKECGEPLSGTRWTLALANLTNPDKHRRLTRVVGTAAADVFAPAARDATIPIPFPSEMFMHFRVVASVAFEGGGHVIETLQHLQQQVADVVDAFQPDFERE
jgi:hypothetical protein